MFFNRTILLWYDAKSNCKTIKNVFLDCFNQTNQFICNTKFWAQKNQTGNFLLFPSGLFIGLFLST